MITLLEIMFFLTLAHLIYESILAPSWRLSLRFRFFALRDEVRALKIDRGYHFDDEHFACLEDSINTMIAMLHRCDVAAIVVAELRYRRDSEFRARINARSSSLDDCRIPEAQSIRRRSLQLIAHAVAVNSGMLCAPFLPFVLLGIGVSAIQRRLRNFSVLSRQEFESVAPDGLGITVS